MISKGQRNMYCMLRYISIRKIHRNVFLEKPLLSRFPPLPYILLFASPHSTPNFFRSFKRGIKYCKYRKQLQWLNTCFWGLRVNDHVEKNKHQHFFLSNATEFVHTVQCITHLINISAANVSKEVVFCRLQLQTFHFSHNCNLRYFDWFAFKCLMFHIHLKHFERQAEEGIK